MAPPKQQLKLRVTKKTAQSGQPAQGTQSQYVAPMQPPALNNAILSPSLPSLAAQSLFSPLQSLDQPIFSPVVGAAGSPSIYNTVNHTNAATAGSYLDQFNWPDDTVDNSLPTYPPINNGTTLSSPRPWGTPAPTYSQQSTLNNYCYGPYTPSNYVSIVPQNTFSGQYPVCGATALNAGSYNTTGLTSYGGSVPSFGQAQYSYNQNITSGVSPYVSPYSTVHAQRPPASPTVQPATSQSFVLPSAQPSSVPAVKRTKSSRTTKKRTKSLASSPAAQAAGPLPTYFAPGKQVSASVPTTKTANDANDNDDDDVLPTPLDFQGFSKTDPHASNYKVMELITANIPLGRYNPRTKAPAKSPTVGTIYIFTRPTDAGYLKIGYTADTLYNRMNTIRAHCGFTPQLECIIEDVPYPARVEALIHFELQQRGLRRAETVCRFGNAVAMAKEGKTTIRCRGGHSEWFEMRLCGRDGAERVVQRWVRWMKEGRPYNDKGQLEDHWKKAVMGLDTEMGWSKKSPGEIVLGKMRAMKKTGEIKPAQGAVLNQVQCTKKLSSTEVKFREEALLMVEWNRGFEEDEEERSWFRYVPQE